MTLRSIGNKTWITLVATVAIAICAVGLTYALVVFFGQAGRDLRISRDEIVLGGVNSTLTERITSVNSTLIQLMSDTSTNFTSIISVFGNVTNSTILSFIDLSDSLNSEIAARIANESAIYAILATPFVKQINTISPDGNGLFTITGRNGLNTSAGVSSNEIYITLNDTGVTAANYSYATITVDAQGRVTIASDNLASIELIQTRVMALMMSVDMLNTTSMEMSLHNLTAFNNTLVSLITNVLYLMSNDATVRSISAGTGLTTGGSPITTTGTISLADTLVTAGSYSLASIIVDAQGRLTSATNGTATITVQEEATDISTTVTTLKFAGSSVTASGTGATATITIADAPAVVVSTQDDGSPLSSTVNTFNFVGAGVVASGSGSVTTITIAGGGGGSLETQNSGTPLSSAVTTINFAGAGVVASGSGATTTVTIAGTSSVTMTGDVSGSSSSNTVNKISGVPLTMVNTGSWIYDYVNVYPKILTGQTTSSSASTSLTTLFSVTVDTAVGAQHVTAWLVGTDLSSGVPSGYAGSYYGTVSALVRNDAGALTYSVQHRFRDIHVGDGSLASADPNWNSISGGYTLALQVNPGTSNTIKWAMRIQIVGAERY